MTPIVGTVILALFLIGLIWIGISRAAEDGFFPSLWTVVVLFFAYQFARFEWGFFYHYLTGNGMSQIQAVSTAYWIGFLIIIAPGMLALKFLTRHKIPFPHFLESYGSTVLGACAGVLLFATVGHWVLHVDPLRETMIAALRVFQPLFQLLGYRTEGFG